MGGLCIVADAAALLPTTPFTPLRSSVRKGKSSVRILGLPRNMAVALLSLAALYLWYRNARLLSLLWGITLGAHGAWS